MRRSARAAAAPIAACVTALAALSAWTALGQAGSPPDLIVSDARVFRPTGDSPDTVAFFRITNRGTVQDELTAVTSPSLPGGLTLSRHRMTTGGAAYRAPTDRLRVPARGTLDMTPMSNDVTVPAGRALRTQTRIPFDLHFAHSRTVRVQVQVVPPGSFG
ncbi:copper chaperone PCu(A)C [Streptomyces sp. SID5785]|uniref:copper chaperone PCu(A)C n=1 Tax=Streptomyces sp. SID5785 TaxID=2690309 RepID=UPI0013617EAF|nr:copper chaperone PCu(A)C [Streptomyces sp. SID5785]MZD10195.1 copper chaperone PCu(A)C [Streptomyces sp. SID5785]